MKGFTWFFFFLQVFGGIFRCYAVVIALFVAVAETEWGFLIKFWSVSFEFFFNYLLFIIFNLMG